MGNKRASDSIRLIALAITIIICYMFIKGDILTKVADVSYNCTCCIAPMVLGPNNESYYMYDGETYDSYEEVQEIIDPHAEIRNMVMRIVIISVLLQIPAHIISLIVSYAGIRITCIIRRVTDCITLVSIVAMGITIMLRPSYHILSLGSAKEQMLLVFVLIVVDFVFVARGFRYSNSGIMQEEN